MPSMNRRTFVKTSGALGALAVSGGAAGGALFKGSAPVAHAEAADEIHWSQCNVNCGGNCIFQWHSKDGKIQYMETDNLGSTDLQARACLRGRAMRRWLNSPDRLMYPMKRVGKRGEGKFERISWDEAIDIIVEKLKTTIDKYGNEAIYINYATGMHSATGREPIQRLLSLLGGYVNQGYDYSTHMLQAVMPYMYGSASNIADPKTGLHKTLGKKATKFSPYDNVNASSFSEAEAHSDLVVMFGNSPAETRMAARTPSGIMLSCAKPFSAAAGKSSTSTSV